MKKSISKILLLLTMALLVWLSFFTLMPDPEDFSEENKLGFSMEKANNHVKALSQKPHSIGTKAHSEVRNYIVQQLQYMGLEVQTQKGYFLNKDGVLNVPENIITKIQGSNPTAKSDLMVMTHYDSAVHSSFGASDAASGVATILETLRVFLKEKIQHKNNLIICFTDAEEIGLNGAGLFVEEHPWAENIGLVLNFEARGSGGPSNAILESNSGNKKLIEAFAEANPQYPVATSLMYTVYKKLPNDTDATVLREEKNIPSFFFAFIDDHFDYHTAKDTFQNLDQNSLAHQASYLTALLPYFANVDLAQLTSEQENVYFNFPGIGMISYSYAWVLPLLILAWILFIAISIYAFRKKVFSPLSFVKSILWFTLLFASSGLVTYFLFSLLHQSYDVYLENQNGFTRNGHSYIFAFVSLAFSFVFLFYSRVYRKRKYIKTLPGPLFIWLLINTVIAVAFKGAAYFIWPIFFGLLCYFIMFKKGKAYPWLFLFLSIPAFFIFSPLIQFFPVGLGLKMLMISSLFVVLLVGLLLPIFSIYRHKKWLGVFFLAVSVFFFVKAHINADFSEVNPKPNSLLYLKDANSQKAWWATYDHLLDEYNKEFFKEENPVEDSVIFDSKYKLRFTQQQAAELKPIKEATVLVEKDSVLSENGMVQFHLKIAPQRKINRIEIFAEAFVDFQELKVNGLQPSSTENPFYLNRENDKLLTYYAIDKDTLRMDFQLEKGEIPNLKIYEASNDLLQNPNFNIPKRTKAMIPKPFILNDAVITKQTISLKAEL